MNFEYYVIKRGVHGVYELRQERYRYEDPRPSNDVCAVAPTLEIMRGMITETLKIPLTQVDFYYVLENVEIDGVSYVVEVENTPESNRARGRDNLAQVQEENGIARTLYIRRPKGRVLYVVHQYQTGNFGDMVRIGR